MTKPAFTPGPWEVKLCVYNVKMRSNTHEVVSQDSGNKAATIEAWWDTEEEKANARLIAAAPDMYEALTNLSGDTPDFNEVSHNMFRCRHCGRMYHLTELPEDARGCSDDCPGHIARAALRKANGKR